MKKIFIYTVIVLQFSCSYDPRQECISIINKTDSAIYVAYSFNDSLDSKNKLLLFQKEYYNDTFVVISPNYRINAYQEGGIGIPGREGLLHEASDKKLRLFFISENTMRKRTWKEVCEKRLYEKKMVLSSKDFKKIDWEVQYP